MKRKLGLFAALIAGVLCVGCIMNIAVDDNDLDRRCHKRVVRIDGEPYLVDLRCNRIRKLRESEVVESTTTTTVEPAAPGN